MKPNSFFKAIVTLVSGTAAAHIVTIAVLPIISRLYSKEQFGELAVLMSSSTILAIVMTLKLEMAIFNRSERKERHSIVFSTGVLATSFLLISLLFVTEFQVELLSLYDNKISTVTLFFIPIAAFFIALFFLITNYAIAEKQFKEVAKVKVQRSVAQVVLQIGLSFSAVGLVVAESLSRVVGVYSLYRKNLKASNFRGFGLQTFLEALKSNIRFLKYSSVAALFNVVSLQFPTLFIASVFGVSGAGVFLLTNRLVALPVSLLGQSMAQVYSSEFSSKIDNIEYLNTLFKKVVLKSFLFSSLIFVIGGAFAEWAVVFFLGEKWVQVSDFIVILTPMLILQFTSTPISNTLNMLECQHLMLMWDFFRLLSMCLLTVIAITQKLDIEQFLTGYSIVISVCYVLILCITWLKLKQFRTT